MYESPATMHVALTDVPVVPGHVFSETLTAGGWLVMFLIWCGLAAVGAFFKEQGEKRRKKLGLPPKPPRQPMDISPFTAGVLGMGDTGSYKPRGVTAITPSGIRVTVRCPHRNGHRTPDLAVACGQREKDRIERTGR